MHGLARHFKSVSVSLCERTVINYTFESQLLQLLKVIHYKEQITNVLALGASLLRTPSVISIKYTSMWESFLKIYFQESFTPFPSNQLTDIESYCFSCLKAHAIWFLTIAALSHQPYFDSSFIIIIAFLFFFFFFLAFFSFVFNYSIFL